MKIGYAPLEHQRWEVSLAGKAMNVNVFHLIRISAVVPHVRGESDCGLSQGIAYAIPIVKYFTRVFWEPRQGLNME